MKKRISAIIFSSIMLAMSFATPVLASNTSLAHSVDIDATEYKDYSATCVGHFKYIWGYNSKYSAHGVWFVAEYQSSGGSWVEDPNARVFLNEGEVFSETSTYRYSTDYTWRLKVDVYGPYKGCQATGYIRNK